MSKPPVLGPPVADDPSMEPVACVICSHVQPKALSFSIRMTMMHAPGLVGSFDCPQVEHWACTADHAQQAAHACIDEHIMVLLAQKQGEAQAALAEQARVEQIQRQNDALAAYQELIRQQQGGAPSNE